jgi:hypothetical protein
VNIGPCVTVVSRDCSRRVDGPGIGEYGARGIEASEGTVGGSQEASSDSGWFDGRQAAFMPLAGGSPSESRVFVNLCCLFDS